MYKVYVIENIINSKVYIGVTKHSLTKRLKDHKAAAKKFANRKLYKEMNSFGFNNFFIKKIDEADSQEEGFTLEKAYIKKYNSAVTGLNESLGGAGKTFIEPSVIIEEYSKIRCMKRVAAKLGCCYETVRSVLNIYGIEHPFNKTENYGIPVIGTDVNSNEEFRFASSGEAGRYCEKVGRCKKFSGGTRQKIINACKKEPHYAYGFYWRLEQI